MTKIPQKVRAIYCDGRERIILYCDLPQEYEWLDETCHGDDMETFRAYIPRKGLKK